MALIQEWRWLGVSFAVLEQCCTNPSLVENAALSERADRRATRSAALTVSAKSDRVAPEDRTARQTRHHRATRGWSRGCWQCLSSIDARLSPVAPGSMGAQGRNCVLPVSRDILARCLHSLEDVDENGAQFPLQTT